MADTIDNVKIYKKVSKTGTVTDQYAVVNLDATNFYITLNATHTLAEEFGYVWNSINNLNDGVVWKADVSTIGTTTVSTKTISTSSASIASGNTDLVTGGAIYSYVDTEGGKIKEIRINGATQTISAGVVNLPAYPVVSNSTITIKQTGINDQTFTLNGNATTITLADTNTWRPLGTGASDAAAGDHTHTVFNGLRINTGVNTTPLKISRGAYDAESVSYGVNDGAHIIEYTNDEVNSTILWRLINTDTESGGGASASTHSMALSASPDGVDLRLDGTAVSLNGHTHTAAEVGALPDSTTYLKSISKSGSTYTITNSANGKTTWTIPTIPSNVSAFTNDAGYLTTVAWGDVTGKPSTFTPTAHTHSIADVTDVSTIGTTAVSTVVISTSSADIAAGNSKLVTGGAIANALANVSYKPTVTDDTLIFN